MTTTPTLGERSVTTRIHERIERSLGAEKFDRYWRGSAKLRHEGDVLTIIARASFYAEWLESRLGGPIIEAAREELGASASVRWVVDPSAFGPIGGAPGASPSRAKETGSAVRPGAPASIRPRSAQNLMRYRLDDFVVGASNRLAFDAVSALANPDSSLGCSTLFLHGECGVGKTHLLQALAARFAETHPGAKVRSLTGEAFTNEYITAVRTKRIDSFRASFRALDLLCIDDVHFISGKEATQSEFMHTFDSLDLGGARVALASDAHPRQIANLSERIVSRCLSGLVARIDRPEHATRSRIASSLAARRGLLLAPGAAEAIADHCPGSVRDIEGALTRVDAYRRLVPEPAAPGEAPGSITPGTIARALQSTPSNAPAKPIHAQQVARVVAEELRVDMSDLMSSSRHKRVVLARSIAAYLARRLTTQSFPEIAKALGRPNHSTIVTACQRVERQIERSERVPADTFGETIGLTELCERLRLAVARMA